MNDVLNTAALGDAGLESLETSPPTESDEEQATEGQGVEPLPDNTTEEPEAPLADSLVEKINTTEARLQERRVAIEAFQRQVEETRQELLSLLPDLSYNNQPIYALSDGDFQKALRSYLTHPELSVDERHGMLEKILTAREEYLQTQALLTRHVQQIHQANTDIWIQEWNTAAETLLDKTHGTPQLKAYLPQLTQHIYAELQKDGLLKDKLSAGGVREKFKYLLQAVKRLGLDTVVESEIYREQTPGLPVPVGGGKGAKGMKTGEKAPTFTREQIAKMSLEEFKRNEKAIDAALKAKRIQ